MPGVLDHVSLGVGNLERSRLFYEQALRPLGFRLLYESSAEGIVGFGTEKNDDFGIYQSDAEYPPTTSVHVAFMAKNREAVDAFYRAAISAGGRSRIPPGVRPEYHPNYYAAFIFDPDGNNIEAVCHSPPTNASKD